MVQSSVLSYAHEEFCVVALHFPAQRHLPSFSKGQHRTEGSSAACQPVSAAILILTWDTISLQLTGNFTP